MLCFSVCILHRDIGRDRTEYVQVDSKDSLENVESKWVGEIAENCQGVKLVLVALKCDLRANADDTDDRVDDNPNHPKREQVMIDYKEGLEVARRIQALRYLGTSNIFLVEYCVYHGLSSVQNAQLRKIEVSMRRLRKLREWPCRSRQEHQTTAANAPLCRTNSAVAAIVYTIPLNSGPTSCNNWSPMAPGRNRVYHSSKILDNRCAHEKRHNCHP